jgi:hypothetical protein
MGRPRESLRRRLTYKLRTSATVESLGGCAQDSARHNGGSPAEYEYFSRREDDRCSRYLQLMISCTPGMSSPFSVVTCGGVASRPFRSTATTRHPPSTPDTPDRDAMASGGLLPYQKNRVAKSSTIRLTTTTSSFSASKTSTPSQRKPVFTNTARTSGLVDTWISPGLPVITNRKKNS